MKYAIIIGESFASLPGDREAFHDSRVKSTQTLLTWLGISHEEMRSLFYTVNAIDRSGTKMSQVDAQKLASGFRFVITLGRIAEKSVLKKGKIPRREIQSGRTYIVLPHPSGLNRILNDPRVRRTCQQFCTSVVKQIITEGWEDGKGQG